MAYQSEIEKLEARYRENPQQWFAALAESYRKTGNLDLALDVVRAGLDKRPNYVSGHIVLGRCLLDQKNDRQAAEAFRRVLELDAENVIALKALADISRRAGAWEETRRWLDRLLEVDPMNEEARQELEALEAQEAVVTEAAPAAIPELEPQGERVAGLEPTAIEPTEPAVVQAAEAAEIEQASWAHTEAAEPEAIVTAGAAATEVPEALAAPEPGVIQLESGGAAAAAETSGVEEALPPGESVEGRAEAELRIERVEEAALGELETMEFTAPQESGVGPAAPGEDLMPFDESLAWGTGERMSRAIDQETLEAALEAREESLVPPEALLEEEVVSTDLPLILPEDVEEKPAESAAVSVGEEEEPEGGISAEPVVTETMAELYAKQGLVTQARDIYRELVARRPGDARLAGRLAELEQAAVGEATAVKEAKIPLARATGGESVREFLARVLGGGSGAGGPAAGADNPGAAGEVAEEVPVEVSGSPTRAAEDEISLAAIFGEEPAPLNPKSSERQSSRSSGFSFDEFFASGGESEGDRPNRGEEDQGDDFTRWLKSLKS